MKLFLPFIAFIVIGCSQSSDQYVMDVNLLPDKVVVPEQEEFHFPDTNYREMECGLSQNKQTKSIGYMADTKWPPFQAFVTRIITDKDGCMEDIKQLKDVVDTNTFKVLGLFHFKDKKHVYHFHAMMEGGTITILWKADPSTFHVLGKLEDAMYAKNSSHCYYRGHLIPNADAPSFRMFDTSYSMHVAKDRNHYYSGEEIMKATEKREINLDSLIKAKRKKDDRS